MSSTSTATEIAGAAMWGVRRLRLPRPWQAGSQTFATRLRSRSPEEAVGFRQRRDRLAEPRQAFPKHLKVLLALTALGALLRWANLDHQSFWADEAVTAQLMRLDLGSMLRSVPESEAAPPLYYVVAWGWTHLFGTEELGLRSLSALLGTAAIPVFYAAASELCSRRLALAVAALASVNPLLVWYSQEARSYALFTLLAALSLWSFARTLRRPSRRRAATWALASGLALAAHYFAAFLVLAEAVWLLGARSTRRTSLPAVIAVAAVGLLLLPLALQQASLGGGWWIRSTALPYRMGRVAKQYLLGYDSPLEIVLMVVGATIVVSSVLIALAAASPRDRGGVRTAGVVTAGTVGIPFVLALAGRDYFDVRNLIAGWLPFAIVVAGGVTSRQLGRWGTAALTVLCAIEAAATIGVAVEPTWQREDWRGAAAALGSPSGPRAIVVPANGRGALRLYRAGLSTMPATGAAVREVAMVTTVLRSGGGVHPGSPPRPRKPPIPGFHVAGRDYTATYSVLRLRAASPIVVSGRQLTRYPLMPGQPTSVLREARTTPLKATIP
jgi:mannosyltransferase